MRQLPTAKLKRGNALPGKPVTAGIKYSKRWHRHMAL